MKLEEICGYLPYRVRREAQLGAGDFDYKGRITEVTLFNAHKIDGKRWKLILHPLSDLTKPCLEGGKIPIVELAKIAYPNWNAKLQKGYCWIYAGEQPLFQFIYHTKSFTALNSCYYTTNEDGSENWWLFQPTPQIDLFQKLFEWHFDVFGLIKKDEAIDINTL